jgi:hypothetical protein
LFPQLIDVFSRIQASAFATSCHLTNRWRQPLAVVKSTFDFMKQFSMFATLGVAGGVSALPR